MSCCLVIAIKGSYMYVELKLELRPPSVLKMKVHIYLSGELEAVFSTFRLGNQLHHILV